MKKHWYKRAFLSICMVSLCSLNAFSENISTGRALISLVYYKDFLVKTTIKNNVHIPGCVLKAGADGSDSMHWHCQEKAYLLRPVSQLAALQQKSYRFQSDYVESNFNHADTQVISVHILKKASVLSNNGNMPVTGIFITHSLNVKQYRFKNIKTGHLSSIKATDNHPFYSEDSGTFVPVSSISSNDHLINNKREKIQLLCSHGRTTHCGISAYQPLPTRVYNLETYRKHTFYAGHEQILVHNCFLPLNDYSQRGIILRRRLTIDDAASLIRGVKDAESRNYDPGDIAFYFFHGVEKDYLPRDMLFETEEMDGKMHSYSLSVQDVAKKISEAPEFVNADAVFIINSAPHWDTNIPFRFSLYFRKIAEEIGKNVLHNRANPVRLGHYEENENALVTYVKGYCRPDKSAEFSEDLNSASGSDQFEPNWFNHNEFTVTACPYRGYGRCMTCGRT